MRPIFHTFLLALTLAITAPVGTSRASEPDLREKIGQMIMVGFMGNETGGQWFGEVLSQIEAGKIGGVLYLGRNIASREKVRRMNRAILAAAGDRPPPLIAIDQEGGIVQRLTKDVGFPYTPSARRIAARMDLRTARQTYAGLALHLRDWGFNLNLGPVADLNVNPANPIIGRLGRSYSADAAVVSRYAAAFVEGHREHGVLTAIKHYPGHGSSRGDSHKGLVDVTNTWSDDELEPYKTLIREGDADFVMTAHIRNAQIQAPGDTDPVSLSKQAITGVLRGELGFAGVVMSDDLQMAGVTRLHDLRETVIRAVVAGTDILLFANDKQPDLHLPDKVIAILAAEAEKRSDLADRIEESWARIMHARDRLLTPPANALPSNEDGQPR